MIHVVGEVYFFQNLNKYSEFYKWYLIKKIVGFERSGGAKTEDMGICFKKRKDAVEYCQFWNKKYFKGKGD